MAVDTVTVGKKSVKVLSYEITSERKVRIHKLSETDRQTDKQEG